MEQWEPLGQQRTSAVETRRETLFECQLSKKGKIQRLGVFARPVLANRTIRFHPEHTNPRRIVFKPSCCKYVDPVASVVIWGPVDFAAAYVVDEDSILRIRHSTLFREAKSAAETVAINDPTTFEAIDRGAQEDLSTLA